MSVKYQLSYYENTNRYIGTWWVNYMLDDLPWLEDVGNSYQFSNNIYLKSKDQTDQAILLIGLGLSQEEIQEILNG